MRFEEFKMIYDEMQSVFRRDKELTHIEITFHIQKVKSERKTAKIDVKTFKE
jgi:hypothetical protein